MKQYIQKEPVLYYRIKAVFMPSKTYKYVSEVSIGKTEITKEDYIKAKYCESGEEKEFYDKTIFDYLVSELNKPYLNAEAAGIVYVPEIAFKDPKIEVGR